MAVATATTEKPNVRTAEADAKADEIFEVEIPEGIDLATPGDEAKPAESEEAEPEPEQEPEPAAKLEKKPKAKVPAKDKDERLSPAAREERTKRKHYAKLWEETEAEKEKLEAELRARRSQPVTATMSKEYVGALKERANKAETMGDLLEITLEEIQKRDIQWQSALNEERFNRHLYVSEALARKEYPAYDKVLKEAGITDAVKVGPDGTFADPAVAKRIYTSDDPGGMAYRLAVGRLEKDGRLDEVIGSTQSSKAQEVEVEEEETETPAAGKKKSAERADDRRAGAREVIEKVGDHSSKPRGLSAVKPAAPPKRGLTRGDLDRMSDQDPDALKALFKANPRLQDWWLGGVEAV